MSGRRHQSVIKKFAGGAVGFEPRMMEQKVVNFVGENELLDVHAARPQPGDQVHGLCEIHVAIVVAMNEEHR